MIPYYITVADQYLQLVSEQAVISYRNAAKPSGQTVGSPYILLIWMVGGIMVTTLRLDSLKRTISRRALNGKIWNPEVYMDALQSCGFTDVRLEDNRDKLINFQAIFATARK
nr:uncharacterized protein LOC100005854 isoform X1 [Danio rerio]|eukprot:XP_021325386.1 uncharacterized protein LOC100005854 isoform X1 [Danio rerio]